ncbi:MAG: ATP-binding protein [Verrucomicrobiota bacterium]
MRPARAILSSIRLRVLLAFLLVGTLPVITLFFVARNLTANAIINSEYEKISEVSNELARQIKMIVENASNDIASLASSPVLVDPDQTIPAKKAEFNRLVKLYENFYDITLLDNHGFPIVSSNEEHAGRRDQTSWFDVALSGESYVSRPEIFHPRADGEAERRIGLFFTIYLPVTKEGTSAPNLVIKGRVRFDKVWSLLDEAGVGATGSFTLIDDFANLLSHKDKSRILTKFDSRYPDRAAMLALAENNRGIYGTTEGMPFIYTAKTISPTSTDDRRWFLVGLKSKEEAHAPVAEMTNYHLVGVAVTLGVALGLGLLLANRLSSPIIQASQAAKRISDGELDVRIPAKGSVENVDLANSFNQMIDEVREHRFELELLVDSRTRRLKRSQEDLEDLSAQLKAAYESVQDGIAVIRNDGTILTANGNLREFFGLDENVTNLSVDLFRDTLVDCFESGKRFEKLWNTAEVKEDAVIERELDLKNPVPRNLDIYSAPVRNKSGKVIARVWMFRDITEQKQLQLSLQQAQKMEAIGRLAGGVAHDFNNLLTGIIGNLQLAQLGNAKGTSEEGQFIESAKKAGQRAAELVKQLLGFSRRTHLELQFTNANEVISDVEKLLTASFDPRIQIEVHPSDDLWGVKIDPTQMEQVVMNMCVNAKDAMPEGGRLRLSTQNQALTERDASAMTGARSGDFIIISVEDNGEGIPPEVMEKIFEPFFTTKEQGKGTGLGLATSYGIVQQHGGWISCESLSGEGTTFRIYLPKQEKKADSGHPRNREKDVRGGDETVLLVDDEAVVRAVAEGALKHHGYRILSASDGQEALDILSEPEHKVDLVLLDLTMPRLSGRETLKVIREDHGDLPVVVCSGFLVDLDGFEEETGLRANGFVQKPYNLKALAGKVRDILDESALVVAG